MLNVTFLVFSTLSNVLALVIAAICPSLVFLSFKPGETSGGSVERLDKRTAITVSVSDVPWLFFLFIVKQGAVLL